MEWYHGKVGFGNISKPKCSIKAASFSSPKMERESFYFQQVMTQINVSTTVYEEIRKELSGARILVDGLKREGVEYIFGVNGGAAMPIFDALYDETEVKLILLINYMLLHNCKRMHTLEI